MLRTGRRMVPAVDRTNSLQIRHGHYRSRAGKDKGNQGKETVNIVLISRVERQVGGVEWESFPFFVCGIFLGGGRRLAGVAKTAGRADGSGRRGQGPGRIGGAEKKRPTRAGRTFRLCGGA